MNNYPRLCLLGLSFIGAYILFQFGWLDWLQSLGRFGYLSVFIAGLLFSFGFTTPFAIAIFIEISGFVHPVPAALLGGLGALISDFIIFDIIRFSVFHDEIDRLRASRFAARIHRVIHDDALPQRVRQLLLFSFAGIIIASPLPDELGVSLVSSASSLSPRLFGAVAFLCNAAGILLILMAARVA
ncbi:MAG: hypothetical protein KBC95_03295 [Candidatus Peribacteraceae bacterium]|nr:hypothetical protein [Candidatus Peribacteraceae bacterium]